MMCPIRLGCAVPVCVHCTGRYGQMNIIPLPSTSSGHRLGGGRVGSQARRMRYIEEKLWKRNILF